ncbi:hypothetical protein [Paenalcaligenes faecalis]|uniref:hypothetical protein n=1 Tax=Paenalcaligenes faecalis TaxID=2980099 RepID=UPI0022B9D366|nr:hypothetical protein [Paenalcaligenes faecalis]
MRFVFFLYSCLFYMPSTAQLLPAFHDLPVQWLAAEHWHWQGQQVTSQRFTSSRSVVDVAQQIQRRLDEDLQVQRLPTAWLLSFEKAHTHYLILLSAQSTGSQGWLSSLALQAESNPKPPQVFTGLFQHSWTMQHVEQSATYFIFQAHRPKEVMRRLVQSRLLQHGWKANACESVDWCDWHKEAKKMLIWHDPNDERWHVLWWPAT